MVDIVESDFSSILPLWETYLWPERKSPILPTSALRLGGGLDLTLLERVPLFLAAYSGTELVGAISGFQTGANSFRARGITVQPEFRRQGVGSALMKALLQHAEGLGFDFVWTAPDQKNIHFYERHGFTKQGSWTTEHFEGGPHCYVVRYNPTRKLSLQKPRVERALKKIVFDSDAFSSGQIISKLWLCEELERTIEEYALPHSTLWHLCGWQGTLPFLLLTRGNLNLKKVRSFDIDENAGTAADQFLNTWEWQEWTFKAICQDIQTLDYSHPERYFSDSPDIVVNCAIEHLSCSDWWQNIPSGKLVVLQATDMTAEDHHVSFKSTDELSQAFPLQRVLFAGTRRFSYASGFQFSRYMLIGLK